MEGTDDWRKLAEGTTDATGTLSYTDTLLVAGTFYFRAICGTCLTNQVTLTVNPAPPATTCTDTDGKNKMTAGFVHDASGYYYDDCAGNWAVIEYFCNGNAMTSQVIACDAGYICYATRGGDYCKLITETPTQYYCCQAMGLKSCYEGGCPPAGIELGVYDSLPACQADCSSGSGTGSYTCSGSLSWCQAGTCPTSYSCQEVSSIAGTWCACVDGAGNVAPDWKPNGQYYHLKIP
jgi:hypothetical protein